MPTEEVQTRFSASDGVTPAIQNQKGALLDLVTAIRSSGLAYVFVGQQLRDFGNRISETFGKNIAAAALYDEALVHTRVITNGTKAEQVALSNSIEGLATKYGVAAQTIANAGVEVAAFGFSMKETANILTVATKLSVVGLTDVRTAATLLITVTNAYGAAAVSTADMSRIFATVANQTAAQVDDLAISMQFAAPMAAQLHISIAETTAALGLLRNAGLDASIAGTNLRQMFVQLSAPTKEAARAIADTGLVIREETSQSRDLKEQIRALSAVTGAYETKNQQLRMAIEALDINISKYSIEIGKNQTAIERAKAVLQSTNSEYRNSVEAVGAANGAIQEYQAQLAGLQGVYDDVSGQIADNNITIMEIERRAAHENRALTQGEMVQIENLKSANEDLGLERMKQSRQIDIVSESLKKSQSAMDENKASMQSLEKSAIAPYQEQIDVLQKKIDRAHNVTGDYTDQIKVNDSAIKANNSTMDDLASALGTAGGKFLDLTTILSNIEGVTRGMTQAQKDAFLNDLLGIRGQAAYNAIMSQGVDKLRDLTDAANGKENATYRVIDADDKAGEMIDNLKAKLSKLEEEMGKLERAQGAAAGKVKTDLTPAWTGFQNALRTTNPELYNTASVIGFGSGKMAIMLGTVFQAIPILGALRGAMSRLGDKIKYVNMVNEYGDSTKVSRLKYYKDEIVAFGRRIAARIGYGSATVANKAATDSETVSEKANATSKKSGMAVALLGIGATIKDTIARIGLTVATWAGVTAQMSLNVQLMIGMATIGAVLLVVGLLVYAFQHQKEVMAGLTAAWKWLSSGLEAAGKWLGGLMKPLDGLSKGFGELTSPIKWLVDVGFAVLNIMIKEQAKIWDRISDALQPVRDFFGAIAGVVTIFADALQSVADKMGPLKWLLDGFVKILRTISDALTGHSVVPDMYKFIDSIDELKKSGVNDYLKDTARNANAISMPASIGGSGFGIGAGIARTNGSQTVNITPTPAQERGVGTTTIRSTTNAPIINIHVKNLDWKDPRTISDLGAAIKKAIDRGLPTV